MIVTKTVWCSREGNRELLTFNHQTRQVTTPAWSLQPEDLLELAAAASQCSELLAQTAAATPKPENN